MQRRKPVGNLQRHRAETRFWTKSVLLKKGKTPQSTPFGSRNFKVPSVEERLAREGGMSR